MSSHHPSSELLKSFAEAGLGAAIASVVSAHIEHCSGCQRLVRSLEQSLSSVAFSSNVKLPANEASLAWKNISSRLGTDKNATGDLTNQNEILIDGVKFNLPRSLKKFTTKPIKWMPFGKTGEKGGQKSGLIGKLGDENGKSLFLIYLASNQEVPLHSHAGAEHSYVISGSYSADGLTFETGDFSYSNKDVIHSPKAGSEDGCLLLSSVENRLNFLHGWMKPFNGLLWWLLHLRTRFLK